MAERYPPPPNTHIFFLLAGVAAQPLGADWKRVEEDMERELTLTRRVGGVGVEKHEAGSGMFRMTSVANSANAP